MKICLCGHCVITILLLLIPAICSVTKRRLCVEYKKENYFVEGKHIVTLHADAEQKCMVNCVRRNPCMAFNYHAKEKTCILMPKVRCMVPSPLANTSYLLVHLHPCKLQPVWYSVRPVARSWYWVTTDDPSNNVNIIKLQGNDLRYIGRVLYQGFYLPGWWSTGGGFRAVHPVTSKNRQCPYGEYLAFSNSSSYWWTSYTAGDPLPDCALPFSQLPDGIPLYIVMYNVLTYKLSGFYNHFAKSTYFFYSAKTVAHPVTVEILCGNGI